MGFSEESCQNSHEFPKFPIPVKKAPTILAHFNRRDNRRSIAIFDRKEIPHLGASIGAGQMDSDGFNRTLTGFYLSVL